MFYMLIFNVVATLCNGGVSSTRVSYSFFLCSMLYFFFASHRACRGERRAPDFLFLILSCLVFHRSADPRGPFYFSISFQGMYINLWPRQLLGWYGEVETEGGGTRLRDRDGFLCEDNNNNNNIVQGSPSGGSLMPPSGDARVTQDFT